MIRLAVRCRPELAERVLAELIALAPGGVEEAEGEGYVELAVYGAPGELPELPALEAIAADALIEVTTTEIPDDWADRWRDFHRPTRIGDGRIVIRPSWEPAASTDPAAPGREAERGATDPAAPGREAEEAAGIDVIVDPGQAFGTGAHATTRLCLELLLEAADRGEARGPLLDLGTGSGVLAIVAAKLGFAPVTGLDSEVAALDAARENAARNGVEIEVRQVDLRREPAPRTPTLVANLTGPLLEEVATRLAEPPELMVCSGLLAEEIDRVTAAFAGAGLAETGRRQSGEWAALRLERESGGRRG